MRHDWKRSFNALLVAEFLAIAGFQTSTPILPFYLKELGVTDPAALNTWNGLINGITSLVLALAAPFWGSLADSLGKKLMLLRASAGGAVLLALMAFVDAPWQLLVLKSLQGLVTGTVAAATVLTAAIVPEEEAGYRMGLLQTAVFLGGTSGPLLGGLVSDLLGNRENFLLTALLLALASWLVFRHVHEERAERPRQRLRMSSFLPDLGLITSNPALATLFLALFGLYLGSGIANPILPIIVDHLNAGAAGTGSLSGLIIGASALAGAISAGVIGKIGGRIGYAKTLAASLAAATLFTIPQGFATSPYLLLALRVGGGLFLGGAVPAINALLAAKARRDRQGAVFGLSSALASGGNALGPALGALVANAAGFPAVFFATAAILGGAALLLLRSRRAGDEGTDAPAAGPAAPPLAPQQE